LFTEEPLPALIAREKNAEQVGISTLRKSVIHKRTAPFTTGGEQVSERFYQEVRPESRIFSPQQHGK
jgi:hypothetical protein